MSSNQRQPHHRMNNKRPRSQPATTAVATGLGETDETEISSDDDDDADERDRYRPRARLWSNTNESDFAMVIDEPPGPSHSTEAAAAAANHATTPLNPPLHHASQIRLNMLKNQQEQVTVAMGHQPFDLEPDKPQLATKSEHPHEQFRTEQVPKRAIMTPGRCMKIDRDSLTIVFDFLTLEELATKAHRLNKEWMRVLLNYQPSQDHPIRRALRAPTPDDLVEPLGSSPPSEFCVCEPQLIGLSKAAPVYRRLVHTLILVIDDVRDPRGYREYSVPFRVMKLISNTELFPSIRQLFCSLNGYPWNVIDAKEGDPEETVLSWRLPPQLHTLDVVIHARPWQSDTPDPIAQDILLRIGETTSIRRLSIQYRRGGKDLKLKFEQMSALTPLIHLIELRLVGTILPDQVLLHGDPTVVPLLSSFRNLTCYSPYQPTKLEWLSEVGVPIRQLRYLPIPRETSLKQLRIFRQLHWFKDDRPYLEAMNELKYFIGRLGQWNLPKALMSLPSSLTHIDLNIDDVLTSDMTESLAHCKLVRTLRLQCQFGPFGKDSNNLIDYNEVANAALALMFGQMKEIKSIELDVGSGLSGRCVNQLYAPHLEQTLEHLCLNNPFKYPGTSTTMNLSDMNHLTALTSLVINSGNIEPSGPELTQIFNSFVSLTHIQLPSQFNRIDQILMGPFAALMESSIADHLRCIEPATLLMDVLPPRYNQMSQLVSLKSLVVRHLEGDASFLSNMRGLTSLSIGLGDSNIFELLDNGGSVFNRNAIVLFEQDTNNGREAFQNILSESSMLMNEISQLRWLRELTLSELHDFNSDHLIHVISALTHLTKLSLILLPKLVDLNVLIERRETLSDLTLRRLPSLSPNTMVISQLNRLRRLVVSDCPTLMIDSFCSLPGLRVDYYKY